MGETIHNDDNNELVMDMLNNGETYINMRSKNTDEFSCSQFTTAQMDELIIKLTKLNQQIKEWHILKLIDPELQVPSNLTEI